MQVARRENRPLSAEDISKFEQFGFIVPAVVVQPSVPSTPARSTSSGKSVSPSVTSALREELESVRKRVELEEDSSSPLRGLKVVNASSAQGV